MAKFRKLSGLEDTKKLQEIDSALKFFENTFYPSVKAELDKTNINYTGWSMIDFYLWAEIHMVENNTLV